MKRIESLLSREIGLNASSIGMSALDAAVKARLRACQQPSLSEYVERLQRDPHERRALVEEIVVSETWFFRDAEVFKTLARHAAPWLRRERIFRVLSLPCATGEEAYSVSISLLDAGFKPSRYTVRGMDVSERVLQQARRAIYGKNSFRGASLPPQQGYFETVAGGYAVSALAREAVTFALGNVLDTSLFQAKAFDVVLCRNLLIYLDLPARARALGNLHHWLTDEGILFGGHAEALELMDPRFQRLEAAPFAYGKQAQPKPAARPAGERRAAPARPATRPATKAHVKVAEASSVVARPSLARATELANGGSLLEARQLCERLIAEVGATPEVYCLLGIVNNAAGQREGAIECFNKALYLDQAHHESLVHLALLYEQRGDAPAAANFRRRAERARKDDGR